MNSEFRYQQMKERDAEFYAGLEKAGFWHDWGPDGSGLFMKYLRRGSGYYIDVGASQLVIDGKIKLKRGQVKEITETGVMLNDEQSCRPTSSSTRRATAR